MISWLPRIKKPNIKRIKSIITRRPRKIRRRGRTKEIQWEIKAEEFHEEIEENVINNTLSSFKNILISNFKEFFNKLNAFILYESMNSYCVIQSLHVGLLCASKGNVSFTEFKTNSVYIFQITDRRVCWWRLLCSYRN